MSHELPYDAETYQPAPGRALKAVCAPKEGGLVYAPEVLYFHFVGLGQASDWQPFVVTNNGDVNIGIAAPVISGLEFELQDAFAVVLQPGESVTYQVRFRPAGEGARISEILIAAGEAEPAPEIRLVGIGGTLTGGPVQGDPSEIETLVTTLVSTMIIDKWAYRYGSFAPSEVLTNEILLDYHVTATHTLQPNFAGCRFSVTTPPTEEFILTVLRDGMQVGQITIGPDGTVVPTTAGGLAVAVPVESIMTVRAPATLDEGIGRLRMTFVGVI
jgi:hypothetical protein